MTQLTVAWPFAYQDFEAAAGAGSWALNDTPVHNVAYDAPATAWTSVHWTLAEVSFNAGQAGGTDATAPGTTLLANASPIGGTFSGGAEVSGVVQAPAAGLVSGSATGAAAATGATIAAAASVIDGVAAGAAGVSGTAQTDTASVVSGEASGAGQAAGQTLSVASSILEGTEAGEGQAAGAIVAATAQPIAGDVSADGNVSGGLIAATASTIPGEAAGAAAADTTTTSATASLVAGTAEAGAQADGAIVSLGVVHFYDGGGTGDATAAGDTAVAAASLIDGQASGGVAVDGTAQGATLEVGTLIVVGVAASAQAQQESVGGGGKSSTRRRRPRTAPPAWIDFVQNAIAKGVTLSLSTTLIAGQARGDAQAAASAPIARSIGLKSGRGSADAKTPPAFLSTRPRLIVGTAHVAVATRSVTLRRVAMLIDGRAEGFDAVTYDNELITTLAA